MADDDDVPAVVAASSYLYVLPHAVNSAEGSVFGAVSPLQSYSDEYEGQSRRVNRDKNGIFFR